MHKHIRFDISAGAILLFALIYFFDGNGVVSALVPAALAHEAGHILALRACKRRLTRVFVSPTGAELDYAPRLEGGRRILCLIAGPLAGLAYTVAACTLGGTFLDLSGTVSFVLSVFNLLPILPLDGGQVIGAILPERNARAISLGAALLFLAGGAVLVLRFHSFALFGMGLWLVVANLRAETA